MEGAIARLTTGIATVTTKPPTSSKLTIAPDLIASASLAHPVRTVWIATSTSPDQPWRRGLKFHKYFEPNMAIEPEAIKRWFGSLANYPGGSFDIEHRAVGRRGRLLASGSVTPAT